MYGIIYKVVNLTNGKVYVGQTRTSLDTRRKQHYRLSKSPKTTNGVFVRALAKYPADMFEWVQVAACTSKEDLDEREIEYIREFNSRVPDGYRRREPCYA